MCVRLRIVWSCFSLFSLSIQRTVLYVIYWRDIKLSAVVLGVCLMTLLTLSLNTFLHTLVLIQLSFLVVTLTYIVTRIAIDSFYNKEDIGNPFRWVSLYVLCTCNSVWDNWDELSSTCVCMYLQIHVRVCVCVLSYAHVYVFHSTCKPHETPVLCVSCLILYRRKISWMYPFTSTQAFPYFSIHMRFFLFMLIKHGEGQGMRLLNFHLRGRNTV